MGAVDTLRAARARISAIRNWTECAFARTETGAMVASCDPKAVCWCAVGALNAERHRDYKAIGFLERAAVQVHNRRSASEVNDELGHSAVLKMYEAAIAAAEAEGR